MAEKLIIGVHGLANKPEASELADWWKTSIEEGLSKNLGAAGMDVNFAIVYWAGHLYKEHLHNDENYHFDALFNDEPYKPAVDGKLKRKDDGFLDKLAAKSLDLGGETLDLLKSRFGFNTLADKFLGKLLKDLNLYYQDGRIRELLRGELRAALLAHADKEIMLVAHSMGSIIAYDVLTLLGQSHPEFRVEVFATIGSPLGLPHVKGKIIEQFAHRGAEDQRVRTPTVVKQKWVNFADRRDPVALDVHLADDFKVNATGVRCVDDLVYNDYRVKKHGEPDYDRNYHKSYGYLRTPEFSDLTSQFLR